MAWNNVFHSVEDFVTACDTPKVRAESGGHGEDSKWYGGATFDSALKDATRGDEKLVAQAEKMLAQIEHDVPLEGRLQWSADVMGAYPIVPEFLQGSPECMRNLRLTALPAPVRIWFSPTCSGGLSAADMLQRGITVVALAMELAQQRPVELWVYQMLHGVEEGKTAIKIRLNSQPLDLAQVAYCVAHMGFTRRLAYSLGKAVNEFNGQWPNGFRSNSDYQNCGPKTIAWIRREIIPEAEPQDVVIGPAFLEDDMINNPVGWINKQLSQYRQTLAE